MTLRSEYSTSQPFYISINKISLPSTRQIRQKHNHLSIPLVSPPHPLPNPNPIPKTQIFLLTACVRPSTAQSSPSYNARLPANQSLSLHIPRYTNVRYATNVYTVQYIHKYIYIKFYLHTTYIQNSLPLAVSTSILNTHPHRLLHKSSQENIGTVRYRLLS